MMDFEEFKNGVTQLNNEYGEFEVYDFLKFCSEKNVYCESFPVLNGKEIAMMVIILLKDCFYLAFALTGGGGDLLLTLNDFEKVSKEVIEREIRDAKKFYENLESARKFLDEGYKNKVILQKTFESKN